MHFLSKGNAEFLTSLYETLTRRIVVQTYESFFGQLLNTGCPTDIVLYNYEILSTLIKHTRIALDQLFADLSLSGGQTLCIRG